MSAEAATASILIWYYRVPDSLLKEVKATASAAELIADATMSGYNNPELRRAVRDAMQTPVKEPRVKRPRLAVPVWISPLTFVDAHAD